MSSPKLAQLSVSEKLDVARGLSWIVFRAFLTILTLPFPSSSNEPSTRMGRVMLPLFRRTYARFTIQQLQYIFAPKQTYESVESFAKSKGIPSKTVALPDGTKAQWLGPETAEKVLLYLCAGGYTMYITGEQIQYIWNIKEFLTKEGRDCAVIVLSYDLLPECKFPSQLAQAVSLLNFLFNECGKKPSDITIVGASAGGHLCLTILSHASHPHPDVPKLTDSTNFAGMVIMSPMTWTNAKTPSVVENETKDMVAPRLITEWGIMHAGTYGSDSYTEPALAPAEWWKEPKVDKLLLLAGGDELLLDSAIEFANKFTIHNKPIFTFLVGQKENHVQPIVDVVLHTRGYLSTKSEEWMKENLWATTK